MLGVGIIVGGLGGSVGGLFCVPRCSPVDAFAVGVDFVELFVAGGGRLAALADASIPVEVEEGMRLLGVLDCLSEHCWFVVHVGIVVELDPDHVLITVVLRLGSQRLVDVVVLVILDVGVFADAARRRDSDARTVTIEVLVIEFRLLTGKRRVGERGGLGGRGGEGWYLLSTGWVAETGYDDGCNGCGGDDGG